jgi:hypothetical protein
MPIQIAYPNHTRVNHHINIKPPQHHTTKKALENIKILM